MGIPAFLSITSFRKLFFGFSVSISGDQAIVGFFGDDDNGGNSGSALIFEKLAGTWIQVAKLTASDGVMGDQFGESVSISGDQAVVGAKFNDLSGSISSNFGSAYIFVKGDGTWPQSLKLTASDGAAQDRFGNSVSISGNQALVAAVFDDDNGSNSGSAYIFVKGDGTGPPSTPGGGSGNSNPPAEPGTPEETPGKGTPPQDPGPPSGSPGSGNGKGKP